MLALIDYKKVAFVLNAFGNYYGNLTVFRDDDVYTMSIPEYSGFDPQPIPEYLFEALVKYAESVRDDKGYGSGVQIFDLTTEDGREALESSY